MYPEEFASRLVKLRTEKGVSARDMSLSIGQNAGYINTIESGKALPSMAAFFYICDYLGITPRQFFDLDAGYPQILAEVMEDLKALDQAELNSIAILAKSLKGKK